MEAEPPSPAAIRQNTGSRARIQSQPVRMGWIIRKSCLPEHATARLFLTAAPLKTCRYNLIFSINHKISTAFLPLKDLSQIQHWPAEGNKRHLGLDGKAEFFFLFQGGFYRLRTEKCSALHEMRQTGEIKVKAEETEAELQSELQKTPLRFQQ